MMLSLRFVMTLKGAVSEISSYPSRLVKTVKPNPVRRNVWE